MTIYLRVYLRDLRPLRDFLRRVLPPRLSLIASVYCFIADSVNNFEA